MTALLRRSLNEFEAQWHAAGAPIVRRLLPAATPSELQHLQEVLALPLHPDLQELWRWHNGVQPAAESAGVLANEVGACAFALLSTDQARQKHLFMREMASKVGPETDVAPEYLWDPVWVPVAMRNSGETLLVVDDLTGAVRAVRWEFEDFRDVISDSLTAVIDVWTRNIRTGSWRWESDRWLRTGSVDPRDQQEFGPVL